MKTLLITLTMLFTSAAAQAEIVTAAQDPWPPFVQEGDNPGISVEIAQQALKTQGYDLRMKLMPWSRAMNEVKNANIDLIVSAWKTDERTKFLRYSEPYASNQIKFITLADNNFEYNGLASLKGKSVGVARGYGYGDEFNADKSFKRPIANDLIANLRKLSSKRIDMTLEDEIVAKATMAANGLDTSKFRFTTNALSTNDVYVVSGISNSRSEKLINAFNKGLTEIKANGSYEAILVKYGAK